MGGVCTNLSIQRTFSRHGSNTEGKFNFHIFTKNKNGIKFLIHFFRSYGRQIGEFKFYWKKQKVNETPNFEVYT